MNIRNLTLTIALISIGFLANAQSGFGIKAGIGNNTNGDMPVLLGIKFAGPLHVIAVPRKRPTIR